MIEFDNNKIRRLDLTLLLVFVGLMRTRKASDVAEELGVTNSSISHSLRRLREIFDDELFLRRPHGLQPTSVAEQIAPSIWSALEAIQSTFANPGACDIETLQSTITIAARDREIASFIPQVFSRINTQAPNIRLAVQSLAKHQILQSLGDGSLDFAIGFFCDCGPDYDLHHLRTEDYYVVARRDHEIWQTPLTLDSYLAQQHVLVAANGSLTGIVDQVLAGLGRRRSVKLSIPSFLAAFSMLRRSDFIATVPSDLVRAHAEEFELSYSKPPITIRPFDVSIMLHRRNRKSALHNWILEKIRA